MSRSKLKSLYITLYITLLVLAGMHSIVAFISSGFAVAWLGAVLATAPMMAFFGWLGLSQTPRTSPNLSYHLILALVGTIISAMGVFVENFNSMLPLIYSGGIALLGTLVYVFWYSRFGRHRSAVIEVGKVLPQFSVEEVNGKNIDSKQFRGNYTIFLFFRGNWCPLCMAQIKEIAAQYQSLEANGVRVALISPQSHANTQKLARTMEVAFDYLVDKDFQAAKKLGIFQEDGLPMGMQVMGYDSDTTLPTVIITDPLGNIILSDQTDNYRVRPEPALFNEVIQTHKKSGIVPM
ncbi:MAG TPA: alkyl hydroperoxide reductase [Gammaproteobacteria bacterium]|nr:alkyl hydroperoxide reductase [Gammaproteobacteria bacterium]